jgi:cyclic beta-1,2-glucan synthetase
MNITTLEANSRIIERSGDSCLDRSPVPLQLMTNGRLATMLSASGCGYIRLGPYAITRWKADISADALGNFIYLRDLENNEFWSTGYQPTCLDPEAYQFSLTAGTASIERRYQGITSRLDVCVHEEFDVDMRRCVLTNTTDTTRSIELTTYCELALHDPLADLCHPGFSKIFIETDRSVSGVLAAHRRPRRNDERTLSASHFLVCDAVSSGKIEYETDRNRFIGRGRTLQNPIVMQSSEPLNGTLGSVLDPILSLRTVIVLSPGESATVYFGLGAGYDLAKVTAIAEQFTNTASFERGFQEADQRATERLAQAGLEVGELPDLLDLAAHQLYGFKSADAGDSHFAMKNGSAASQNGEQHQESISEFLAIYQFKPTASASEIVLRRENSTTKRAQAWRGTAGSPSPNAVIPPREIQFANPYGGFTEDGREYVIQLQPGKDGHLNLPPMPWNNVIANENIGFIASETGAGNTWSSNSRLNRLTPWLNDPVCDPHCEVLYLRDRDSAEFWSLTPGPTPGSVGYEVCHGWGYSTYHHIRGDLEQEVTLFVPVADPVKISRIQLTNRENIPRRLSFYSYLQWELGEGLNLTQLATRTEIDPITRTIFATNVTRAEFSDAVAFTALAGAPGKINATCDRTEFLGMHGSVIAPWAVANDGELSGNAGVGLDPCAAMKVDFVLEPGQTVRFAVLLGETASPEAAKGLVEKYQVARVISDTLAEAQGFWRELNDTINVETPAAAIDLMVNGWLPYQNISCRLWGRTSPQQSGGAYGFRDQLQDASALVFHRPDLTRTQILRNAAHQFIEGDVLHWWHPPLSRGIRTTFSDDLLWMPMLACEYVEATGDTGIWEERVRYLTAEELPPGEPEVYLIPSESGEFGTLYEHCCRALDRGLTRGRNGLPLMGCGDWNDGMNRVGQGGMGESVWMGFFIDYILERMLPVIKAHGERERFEKYSAYREELRQSLEEAGWDGAWYRRAYFDDGTPLGTSSGKECRIDALVQAWAVMSGAAPPDRAAIALAAADEHLVDEEAGIIRLLHPPFNKMPNDPGYIKGYLPGIRENGGQYTHGILWLIRAFAESGQGIRACKLLEMISPVSHTKSPDVLSIYQSEPYVVAADVYGYPPHVGRAGWTWYTGSAGWFLRVALESILGLHLEQGKQLRINPAISSDWPECKIRYRPDKQGTVYEVVIHNPHGNQSGVKIASVDGASVVVDELGAHVPLHKDGRTHHVIVEL